MVAKRIDPIRASKNIRETYVRYLITSFGIKNPELAKQFKELANNSEGLFRGPVLESTPKYKKGKSILDIVNSKDSFLSDEFRELIPGLDINSINKIFPLKRELYSHQEKALRKVAAENRNIVVATGTGSGKTESFLLPIIDYLLKERQKGQLGPGVRALLLYPMNALANDQIARLRKLLPPETGISFGRYTGQTKYTYKQGIEAFKNENNNEIPQSNEFFCRNQILGLSPEKKDWPHKDFDLKVGPPNLLLTNFAMLEYLLMRPADSALFDTGAGNSWRFIVLDEAHVYSGAQGTEIGYLIRRLKDRICRSQKGKLLCIATSATIGADDDNSKKALATSFENLFGEPYDARDIITGDVVPPQDFLGTYKNWGKGCVKFYQTLDLLMNDEADSVVSFISKLNKKLFFLKENNPSGNEYPDNKIIHEAIEPLQSITDLEAAKDIFLYNILAGDSRVRALIDRLEDSPVDLKKAAKLIWQENGDGIEGEAGLNYLICLVHLASRARLSSGSASLLACRYHYFVRSIEGLSICLVKSDQKELAGKWPKLLLGRHSIVPDAPDGEAVAFEVRACGRCGQTYLHGYLLKDGRFTSYLKRTKIEEEYKKSVHLVIDLHQITTPPEDEAALRDEKPPASEDEKKNIITTDSSQLTDEQFLCSRCGYIADTNKLLCKHCSKNEKRFSREWISVRQVKPSNGYIVKVCPACGGQKHVGGSIIRPFSPGDDAAGTVLAHSLMTEIPETSETQILAVKESNKPKSRFTSRTKTKTFLKTAGKKRLLAFSDSRQDAAYFATFLDRTANHILHRQFIIQAAKKLLKDNPGIDVFGPADLKNPLIEIAQKNGLFDISFTELEKSNEVFKWINSELIGIQKRNGLEGVGLLTWDLKYRNQLIEFLKKHDEGIFEDYKLHAEEFIKLLEIILSELRKQNVLQALPNVDIRDSYFWPRNRPYSIRETSVNPALSISAWTPQSARKNIRSDYIQKLYKKLDVKIDNEFVKKLLSDLWDLTNEFEDGIIWEEIPSVNTLWGGRGNDGTVWQLKNNSWVGRLHSNKIYKCNLCGNYSSLSLKHICPVYNCSGELTKIIPEHEFKDNHYRNTYEGASVPISVLEHTAQLTNQEGAERQRNFTNDKNNLNILSCSTTFELGVDVGELHAVFLRNVPPTVSNYIQRSGRAGRRLSAAAFVLTFCRTRPHDLGYFDMVNKLIAGKIKPSLVTIDNSRIARRHLHAVVLSHFWRHNYPRLFNGPENKKKGIVKWMFFETDKTVSQLVYDWLAQKPEELIEELIRIFPEEIFNKIGLDNWGWVSKLIDFSKNEDNVWEGSLGLAQSELTNEYNEYEKLGKETPRLFNYAASQQKRITERQSLGFLASRNVLPKYGFPVDVVSLKIQSKDNWAQRIELDRDLKLALGEYAPGCTLVANGKVIKSYALEKIAGRQWPEYQFIICKECGRFYRTSTSHGDKIEICDCGNSLLEKSNTLLEGNFIIPYLGFRTKIDEDGQDPVEIRPQRTFPTRVYFSHYETTFMNKFIHEGDPDPLSGYRIKKRYSRDGTLAVLNPGRSNRGFWVCPSCGFGDSVAEGQPKKHKTPWGKPCKGHLKRVFLGHEFQSDVLEIRIVGAQINKFGQGFWLSLTAALLAGAAKALDIERTDIDGTVLQFGGDGYRSFVLFDTVPGGAGHVRRINNNLKCVMQEAFNISDNCPGCSREQSCNSCLRNYNNQFVHDLLQRGEVADFLGIIISNIYEKGNNGYFSLGMTDTGRWIEQQIKRSNRIDLVLDEIPVLSANNNSNRNWYNLLQDLSAKGNRVRLFLNKSIKVTRSAEPLIKASLHSLAMLSQNSYVEIFDASHESAINDHIYFETGQARFAGIWSAGEKKLTDISNIKISHLNTHLDIVNNSFNSLAEKLSDKKLHLAYFEKLLQGTRIIQVDPGTKQTWKDIISPYIPRNIKKVNIYDRFIRNNYQFKSLEMFIDAMLLNSNNGNLQVDVKTTSENKNSATEKFRKLQHHYRNTSLTLKYNVIDIDHNNPHFRRVEIESVNEACSIWLDRGLDIFIFSDYNMIKHETRQTYAVIEQKQL